MADIHFTKMHYDSIDMDSYIYIGIMYCMAVSNNDYREYYKNQYYNLLFIIFEIR